MGKQKPYSERNLSYLAQDSFSSVPNILKSDLNGYFLVSQQMQGLTSYLDATTSSYCSTCSCHRGK